LRITALIFWVLCLIPVRPSLGTQDTLFEAFAHPPAQARPFVRWWWNGIRVTPAEVLRQMDVMKAAGIGGFEMNSIGMPAATPESLKATLPLVWLSPPWCEVVKTAAEGARERGLIADLIVGSGWPFGGRFLAPGDQIQIVTVKQRRLTGPARFRGTAQELAAAASNLGAGDQGQRLAGGSRAKLIFLRLVPAQSPLPVPGLDLMDKVKANGQVAFKVPAGDYVLYSGAWRAGYRQVVRGGPGAEGPVLNHLNAIAVERYLHRLSTVLHPVFQGRMGDQIRAMFCDSLELGHTNWTADMAGQFLTRRGYDPMPYLHYMVDLNPVTGATPYADQLRRLRYDFNVTVIELFMERFLATFAEWCRTHGLQSRAQSYGRESHPLDASFLVDIPEGETWIRDAEKTSHPCTINRYVASAAHLTGKTEVSCESMTNTVTVFRVLPRDLKRTDDMNFISGTTHSVLHGYNYAPRDADFPGWVQFGCFFSERNSWWPYFRCWADYNARISSVLQSSTAQARVAILNDEADIWSSVGRPYHPFAEREAAKPWYRYRVWEALHQNGYNVDYVSDRVLGDATFENGRLRYRTRAYDVLILNDIHSLLPETAERVEAYAQAGGKILFVGQVPTRSPGFRNAEENDAQVQRRMAVVREGPVNRVAVLPGPTRENIVSWTAQAMAQLEVAPDVAFSQTHSRLSQIHHRAGDRDIFFLCWTDMNEALDVTAEFATGDRVATVWDPETGQRYRYPATGPRHRLDLHFEPQESRLLVFEPGPVDDPVYQVPVADTGQGVTLSAPWQVDFAHAVTEETFSMEMDALVDLGASEDRKCKTFAGCIQYRTTFIAADTSHSLLDLGRVEGVSEVRLNDQPLGVRWYGRHLYDIAEALNVGENSLEVKVTTHLGNYVAQAKRGTPAGRYSWWYPYESMGLLGPVRLVRRK
jgi:hypothetical protein